MVTSLGFVSNNQLPAIRLRINTDDVVTPEICYGCTVDVANYDPYASDDDGSCFFTCPGCTDAVACNFDDDANLEDGSCEYSTCAGCTHSLRPATSIFLPVLTMGNVCFLMSVAFTEAGQFMPVVAMSYRVENAIATATRSTHAVFVEGDNSTCTGCTYPNACNYDDSAIILDVELLHFWRVRRMLGPSACNYNPTVAFDDGSCAYDVDAIGVCGGTCQADNNGLGVCDSEGSRVWANSVDMAVYVGPRPFIPVDVTRLL